MYVAMQCMVWLLADGGENAVYIYTIMLLY